MCLCVCALTQLHVQTCVEERRSREWAISLYFFLAMAAFSLLGSIYIWCHTLNADCAGEEQDTSCKRSLWHMALYVVISRTILTLLVLEWSRWPAEGMYYRSQEQERIRHSWVGH